MMVKKPYTVRFATPAFLGDAEQNGAWRTPPFKALLRQWWRVAVAKDHGYNHARLRETEGRLFGNAWIQNDFRKSEIRLRLDRWDEGKLKKAGWSEKSEKIPHPEVTNKKGEAMSIGADLYLGYGPLNYDNTHQRTTLKANAAIQEGESAKLYLAYPNSQAILADVMQLIHWFGTIGGRSRNGWGSLLLEDSKLDGLEMLNQSATLFEKLAKPFGECLTLDWPHAFGRDNNGLLIWKSNNPHNTWHEVMVELAEIKIAFRTALHFDPSRHHRIDKRHVLAYPITHHNFSSWGNQSRLANQLRFKVTKIMQGYIGVAYHLPCSIPRELLNKLTATDRAWIVGQQLAVWRSVHGILDTRMQRI